MIRNTINKSSQNSLFEEGKTKTPAKEIYIAVDACAEFGGKPYEILEALQKTYKITGRRNLNFIDTEQGFHEKSNCTIPDFISIQKNRQNNYIGFLNRNPEWTNVIVTTKCNKFRNDLATKIIPKTVLPLIELSEKTSEKIQEETFKLMKEYRQTHINGKKIYSPYDIEVKIKLNEKDNYIFVENLVSKAADKVLPFWNNEISKIESLHSNSHNKLDNNKYHKRVMASKIKASQEIKAFSYGLTKLYSPLELNEIKNLPKKYTDHDNHIINDAYIGKLSEYSHIFSDTRLSKDTKWWEKSEAIQALRMTNLWPWSLKNAFSEETKIMINNCHKNAADMSYLKLYTDTLPELNDPKNTLFILLTHDAPLIKQFLETSTSISKTSISEQKNVKNSKKIEVFTESKIYEQFSLTKRNLEEYPHQAAWVGSEFVRFIYKEILDSIKGYIGKNEHISLVNIIEQNNAHNNWSQKPYNELKLCLNKHHIQPPQLKTALYELLEKGHSLEIFLRDKKHSNITSRNGEYHIRKQSLLDKKQEMQIR